MVAHRRAAFRCSRRSPRGRASGLGAPREPRVRRCTGSAAGKRGQRSALSILSLCYYCTRLELRAFVGSVDLVCPGLTAPGALPLAQRLRLPPGPTTVVAPNGPTVRWGRHHSWHLPSLMGRTAATSTRAASPSRKFFCPPPLPHATATPTPPGFGATADAGVAAMAGHKQRPTERLRRPLRPRYRPPCPRKSGSRPGTRL